MKINGGLLGYSPPDVVLNLPLFEFPDVGRQSCILEIGIPHRKVLVEWIILLVAERLVMMVISFP